MVYSSRSGRAPEGRSFEVTAARLVCDGDCVRVPLSGVSRPTCRCMFAQLT
jgi:hypothetical protein